MLTIEDLKEMKPNTIFATGETLIVHPWFNDATDNLVNEKGEPDRQGRFVKVKWVAIRGGIHDWAIYHSLDANLERSPYLGGFSHLKRSFEDIAKHGAKLRRPEKIRELVDPTSEAMDMYRL